jgi:hypothetical protein
MYQPKYFPFQVLLPVNLQKICSGSITFHPNRHYRTGRKIAGEIPAQSAAPRSTWQSMFSSLAVCIPAKK